MLFKMDDKLCSLRQPNSPSPAPQKLASLALFGPSPHWIAPPCNKTLLWAYVNHGSYTTT